MPKWIQKWKVPSSTDASKIYVVSLGDDGSYGCSCPQWKFRRRECNHILDVKAGLFPQDTPAHIPEIILANVCEVTPNKDGDLLTLLIPLEDSWFAATVAYDLLKHGVPWSIVGPRYGFGNPQRTILGYITARGRKVYDPEDDIDHPFHPRRMKVVPVKEGGAFARER